MRLGSACTLLAACQPAGEQAPGSESRRLPPAAAAASPASPAEHGDAPPALSAGQMASIPAGPAQLGSAPGSEGRVPAREADGVRVQLGAFRIDRMPYPNAPGKPPRTGVTRAQAADLCEEAGKRLCTEVEWERACAGPTGARFVTGDALDVTACASDPAACGTPEGAQMMGVTLAEWTDSEAPGGLGGAERTAVVRGAAPEAALPEHRCAARHGRSGEASEATLGFRCCTGESGAPPYPAPEASEPVEEADVKLEQVRAALAAVPQLASHARSFVPFDDEEVNEALRRGDRSRGGIGFWQILPSVTRWSPADGEELVVVSGRSDRGALIALFHELPDGKLTHAASTVIEEKETSVALGFNAEHREQLFWTTCYDCPGEDGLVAYTDDHRVRFGYR
jgi:hypothetical protein